MHKIELFKIFVVLKILFSITTVFLNTVYLFVTVISMRPANCVSFEHLTNLTVPDNEENKKLNFCTRVFLSFLFYYLSLALHR